MNQQSNNTTDSNSLTRSAFWTSAVFYGLIAFEFFYMFSPFAAYIYSVYGPSLQILNLSESTSWLIAFFMPHIARETQSLFITWHEMIGMVIFSTGLLAFALGAGQIYCSKLTRGGAVSGGIYRWIRHPQYVALMVASFGMVLVWPRYLVLFGFVTVCLPITSSQKQRSGLVANNFQIMTNTALGQVCSCPPVSNARLVKSPGQKLRS
ncbi:DUF1295 domain-containing protein [Aliifodinibius sp. S!AR15-10]|uniref:methyltransferase family protein n=1 Tax=Aliifodinibius sp. S!AR15-10 TaxID=2950437 RepID=UPI002862912D|nr:methyltransferase [Aliifodinibius sp. S!AR15-10]MDR8389723.1 DUF1295 domain-containing protein [Aliifodinibius sp. S!AR15-10]